MQGGITSPKLFNTYINSLICELTQKCKGVYAYADDIACLCQNIHDTKKVIKCIEKWT